MAKMFYSLEEAAQRLHKSEDEVREMASSGQIQEFRDGQKLMFKVEQVDLLAPDDDSLSDDMISLEPSDSDESGLGLDLADDSTSGGGGFGGSLSMSDESGAGDMGLDLGDDPAPSPSSKADSAGRSGISVFDVDDLEEADPSAVTQVNDQGGFGALLDDSASMDTVGSGSGLMDLTREKDDTSLGANLLDDIYSGDEQASNETIGASGLFEATGASSDEPLEAASGLGAGAGGGAAMVAAEPYDGAGSGLVGGLALGAAIALAMALVVSVMGILGSTTLVDTLADSFMIVVGALAGATLIFAVVGLLLGKRG
ncbi:MAG: helix-turn-helix domain-containing protein [Phycisphaerales bacterium]